MHRLYGVLLGSRREHTRGTVLGRSAGRRALVILASTGLALAVGLSAHPAGIHADAAPSVTGAGHFQAFGGLRTFSFTAHLTGPGTVATGQAELDDHATGGIDHIQIDCLSISGNTADIGGTITSSSIPSEVGVHGAFSVIDNGQGKSATADQMTLFYLPEPGCVYNFSGLYSNLDGGAIHVRS
jgi:hypothetical protein